MNTKKTSAILKSLKPKASKKPSKKQERVKIQSAANRQGISKQSFWGKIFALRGLSPDDMNSQYIYMIMELQRELKQAYDRFERNKSLLTEVVRYNKIKARLEQKLKIIHSLRFSLAFSDHQQFIHQQNLSYKPSIPTEKVKEFLSRRTAIPVSEPAKSIVGSLTERQIIRDSAKRARAVLIDAAGMELQPRPPKVSRYSQDPAQSPYLELSSVPWFKTAKGLLIQEDVVEKGHLLYHDGVLVPRLLAIKHNDQWWLRVKKSWLTHVAVHGRPFRSGKIGYLLNNNTVHVETEEDYKKYIQWRENTTKKEQSVHVENLFTGVSNHFVQSLLQECESTERLMWFMATLDPSISNNHIHRMRFYSEHYKPKIVKLAVNQIFPEIFYNSQVSKDQMQMVKRQIVTAKKKIEIFLKTGKTPQQPPNIPVKLPIYDIGVNPNAFWYLNTDGNLSIGDLLALPENIHAFSKPYVSCLIPTEISTVTDEMDLENVFEGVPRPKLLAPYLFQELNKELDAILGRFYDRDIRIALPQILDVTKNKLSHYYDTLNQDG